LSHLPADALWVRVYYEDTDFSGRVYHASYLRFLERGRTEWLRRRGFAHRDLAERSGVVFAVRSLQIEFLAPAMMDDLLGVETSVAAARGASIEFKQRILRGDKELATATVLAAAIRDGRPARVPADLRRLLQASGRRP
jgi:acyl-CoA thioester hydrolase